MARSSIIHAKNNTGTTIKAGSVVYISGYDQDAGQPTIALASNDDEGKMPAIGVVREDAANGEVDIVIKTVGGCPGFETTDITANTDVFVGKNGTVVFGVEPSSIDENLITQQIGTTLNQEDYPLGVVQLFPLEVKRRIRHPELIEVEPDQHHYQSHADRHRPSDLDPFLHAVQHRIGGGDEIDHNTLANIDLDGHIQYSLVDGTRDYTGIISYNATKTFTDPLQLISKDYADLHIKQDGSEDFTGIVSYNFIPTFNDPDQIVTKRYVDSVIPGEVWRDPVIDKDRSDAPLSPSAGDRYIVGPFPPLGDAWDGLTDKIVEWDEGTDSWIVYTPVEGWVAWVSDENAVYAYDGADWNQVTGSGLTGSGVAGQVTFWNSPSSITGDNGLFWDNTNKRLGIGTASPQEILDISGAIRIGAAVAANDGTIRYASGDFEGRKAGVWVSLTASGGGTPGGATTNVQFNNAGVFAGDSNFVWDNTNKRLGIGITPTASLHVNGLVRFLTTTVSSDNVQINTLGAGNRYAYVDFNGDDTYTDWGLRVIRNNTGPNTSSQIMHHGTGVLSFETLEAAAITFNTNNSERIRILSDGKVGIGTTAPQSKLDIEGSVAIGATYSGTTAAPANGLIVEGVAGFGTSAPDASWQVTINRATEGQFLLNTVVGSGRIGYGSAGTWPNADFRAFINAMNGAHIIIIPGTPNGNVGIGYSITAPQNMLAVEGNMSVGSAYGTVNVGSNNLAVVGNIGIGTPRPHEALTVNGIIALQEQDAFNRIKDGYGSLWAKSDGKIYFTNDAGTEYDLTASGTSGLSEQTFQENKDFWNDAIYHIQRDLDGYASDLTISEHYTQHSGAIQTILKGLDGYAADSTVSEHYYQYGNALQTIVKVLDGYASDLTVSEHYTQHSETIQTILKDLDGYASDLTVSEHYLQHSDAIQTIIKELDGYSSDLGLAQTVQEHYEQHSEAIQTILKDLDGYGAGVGDITGSGADGYITFWTGEKTISGSESLYFDSNDGYLGVGTDSPNERLTVSGAISMSAVPADPAEEDNYGKIYVTPDGKLMFLREDGEKFDLTLRVGDIDGGSFQDTYENVGHIDAGSF